MSNCCEYNIFQPDYESDEEQPDYDCIRSYALSMVTRYKDSDNDEDDDHEEDPLNTLVDEYDIKGLAKYIQRQYDSALTSYWYKDGGAIKKYECAYFADVFYSIVRMSPTSLARVIEVINRVPYPELEPCESSSCLNPDEHDPGHIMNWEF